MSEFEKVIARMESIENSIGQFQEKAGEEIKVAGSLAAETKAALDAFGETQHELGERLLTLEQNGGGQGAIDNIVSMGQQFTESQKYADFQGGNTNLCRMEVQANTLTGSDTNVAPDRRPGIVGGDFQFMTLESLFDSIPTSSNAIEYTKEASFTNAAAEAAEAAEKAESALTWSLVNMPVSTVAHWIKISRQLAMDNLALAAYVNARMMYGVNRRVETQLGAGNGTAPNISGILDSGNYTAHGYADAALGSTLKKLALIRLIIGDLWVNGYMPDAILLNPADWAQIEIDLLQTSAGQARVTVDAAGVARLFGVPVVQSNGITADNVVVGAFRQAGAIYNREGVVIEMSNSDDDNFTKNLITIRAERRLALTIERATAIIGGDLTPA